MGTTNNFGLTTVGPGEAITDDGNKYTKRDRETIDSLLWTLFNHSHEAAAQTQILFEGPTQRPTLTLDTNTGQLPPGQDFYYRISYRDTYGNETEASIQQTVSTPAALAPPPVLTAESASTGGLLGPGTYRYALSHYQGDPGGTYYSTRAPNIFSIVVPAGTNTNEITITLNTPPTGTDGWFIFRRDPATDEYYYLDALAAPATEYVDDGSETLDCNRKRPTVNNTNSSNSVLVEIDATDLPLDERVVAWRIYRTTIGGVYSANSLVAEVVETTTEGGSILVSEYNDEGFGALPGIPLEQTSIPPVVRSLDASGIFSEDSGRLPSELAPWKVHQHHTFIPGELAVQVYNQNLLAVDMVPNRIEVFAGIASDATATDYGVVRVKDTATVNEVHHLYTNAEVTNEVQTIVLNATAGTFTLTFSAQTTAALDWDTTSLLIKEALEDLSNVTEVIAGGTGSALDPFTIEFVDPDGNVAQMTANTGSLTGTVNIATSIEGSDGGTFLLLYGVDTTAAIAFDASAATVATQIETLTGIVDVTVTGVGTEEDPWVIEYVNPASTNIDLLEIDDDLLNGGAFIFEAVRGHGNTIIEVRLNDTDQYYFWQTTTTPEGEMEAESEDASVTTDGVPLDDQLATNDVAIELDTDEEFVAWNVGVLDAGDYVARFWVGDPTLIGEFTIAITDLNGPTVLETATLTPARPVYTPAYELEFTSDGVYDLEFRCEVVGGNRVMVDKFAYEAFLPTFLAGETLTVEGVLVNTPTNAGENIQVNIWY